MPEVKPSTHAARQYYRQTFDMHKGSKSIYRHTLIVNPDDLNQEEPARVQITPTLGGAYVTDFGSGLPTVTITGTTGYSRRTTAEGADTDGREAFLTFRQKIYRHFVATQDPKLSLYWYNWEDDEYYEIQPQSFRLQRNKSEPLLYRYEFRFTCLRRLLKNKPKPKADQVLAKPSTLRMNKHLGSATSAISEMLHRLR